MSYVDRWKDAGDTKVSEARLAQTVAEQIREMIAREGMSAGDKLPPESELMARYGVGRSTVREAVKQLQAENVVMIRRGLGSFVADRTGIGRDPLGLSFEEQDRVLRELMEVRLLLEPGIAGEAAQRRTQADVQAMQTSIDRMAQAHGRGEDYQGFDYDFHLAMAQSVHNSVLRRIYPVIFEAIAQGYTRTAHMHGSADVALGFHREILAAIIEGDSAAASQATRQHILQALKDINRNVKGENEP